MNKKPVCVVLHSDKNKKHKVCLTNFSQIYIYIKYILYKT